MLPLLRRTLATYAAPERRSIGEQIRRSVGAPDGKTRATADDDDLDLLDPDRVRLVLPVLRQLLSVEA